MFKENKTDDFAALIRSLDFTSTFEPTKPLIHQHLHIVQRALEEFLTTEPLVTNDIKLALSKLPEENLLRMISSPYLCELLALSYNNPADVDDMKLQILQALVAEIKLHDPKFSHPLKPQWTVSGDIVLDPKIAKDYPVVYTDCGIHLNYQSYIHNTGKDGVGGYNHQMVLEFKTSLETAKKIIKDISTSANSLVELYTTSIQFRQNTERPNVVNSSTHTSIGLIRCDNFHKIYKNMPEVVDMLVHESIHQYLHLFEEQLFDFVNVEETPIELLDSREFPSPWSGKPLDIRSYTHAILVWYGLMHFWQDFLDSGKEYPEVTRLQAKTKLTEAVYGFLNSDKITDNLSESKKYLHPEFYDQVERLHQQVKLRLASDDISS